MTMKNDAKFQKQLTCGLKKWHEEFSRFSPEHLKVSKLGLWLDPFVEGESVWA